MFYNVCLGNDEENSSAYSQYKGYFLLYILGLWLVGPIGIGAKAVEGWMCTCQPHNPTSIKLKDKHVKPCLQ